MTFIQTPETRWAGTNLERAANHNQRMTLHAIRVHRELTRVELAAITGLTAPAISNITRRLLDEGLIVESGQRRGGRGQPATRLTVRPDARHAIGLNIDRDHITLVVLNFTGQVLARATRDVRFALPEQVRSFYRQAIVQLLEEAGVLHETLIGIGVAVPDDLGVVDLEGRPAAYAQWSSTNLTELLSDPFNLPVFVENDAAAAALGELQFGLGQRHRSFFYILVSSGLGGSLVIDGSLFRGANGRSGELGFMRSAPDGGRETVQSFVSLSGLGRMLGAAGLGIEDVVDRAVPTAAASRIVDEWIDGAAARLEAPVEAINCLINPDAVLLGGRLPPTIFDRLADAMRARLLAQRSSVPVVCPIMRAAFSTDAPAVGAAILPINHFFLPAAGGSWKKMADQGGTLADMIA
ncbi:ROK family transcriptional regulator [Sphingomonas sp.]|uniref:ROK family transcriptional regulator n=1 Tax=Sphingomonas sp. TaxID=28214 RepID=UPI001ECC91F9|nr:ROK family transcriptional regulator [Sphingomonas sp.]MBX3594812.1 ROK family transcriptional regulator [Sphingomonas sp.]